MNKIEFENASVVTPAKVTINGTDYEVTPAQLTTVENYLSAETLNGMQTNIENAIGDVSRSNWGNNLAIDDYQGDLNDLKISGYFTTGENTTNTPSSGEWFILVMVKNPTYYVKQIAFGRQSNKIYQRYILGMNTWTSWSAIVS